MDEAGRLVREAAESAQSNDDLVRDDFEAIMEPIENDMASPLDEETLDEQHSTQMGEMWGPRRRDAND